MKYARMTRAADADQYTATAKVLHWAIVTLLVLQFAVAWTMPGIGRGTEPETLINLHLSFGAVILVVMVIRLLWRLTHPAPPPPEGRPGWQLFAARWVHGVLYVLLFTVPVLGWMNASYRGWHITLFRVIELPSLIAPRAANAATGFVGAWSGDVHVLLSYALIGAIGLHVVGALYHRFVLQDALLGRMLPNGQIRP